jgi:hypothetical protein
MVLFSTRYLDFVFNWHCIKGGGLHLGVLWHFPSRIVMDDMDKSIRCYDKVNLTFGLIFCRVGLDFKYRYRDFKYE